MSVAIAEELQVLWFLVTNTNIQAPLLVCSTAPECCTWGITSGHPLLHIR